MTSTIRHETTTPTTNPTLVLERATMIPPRNVRKRETISEKSSPGFDADPQKKPVMSLLIQHR